MFYPEFARVGGLLAYGTNLIDLFFQAGVLVPEAPAVFIQPARRVELGT